MSLFLHVLKRVALVMAGYVVALVAGLFVVILLYGALSALPGTPQYFTFLSTASLLALLAPPVALFVLLLAVIVTAPPMLAAAAITEIFALRLAWLHMILAALVGLCGFVLSVPTFGATMSPTEMADLGIMASAGAAAGVVYWLIAGRSAGFRRPMPPSPVPVAGWHGAEPHVPAGPKPGTP